ncbi:MAG: NDP-sugar synthase [Vicinamibacterales bacterium]
MTPPRTALVLAAGHGTRARPLTAVRAKPALPLGTDTLVSRILRWLRDEGVERVVVNLHHRPESVVRAVHDGLPPGLSVRFSSETRLLGSAGGPRHALPLIEDDPFYVVNGDTLTNVDLGALARRHEEAGALVTMAVMPSPDPRHYGGVIVGERDDVIGFARPGRHASPQHFVGVQIMRREAVADLPDGEPAETVWGVYPQLLSRSADAIAALRCRPVFHDIGTVGDYIRTARQLAGAGSRRGSSIVGHGCEVDATAELGDSILWDDVRVGGGASVVRSIVVDGVTVPQGAVLRDAIVFPMSAQPLVPDATSVSGLLVVSLPVEGRP